MKCLSVIWFVLLSLVLTLGSPSCGKSDTARTPTSERLAKSIATTLREVCTSTTHASGTIPKTGKVLVVWADSGKLVSEIQGLLVQEAQAAVEQELVFVVGLTRNDVRVCTYLDGNPGYRIDYHVKLLLYQQREVVSEFTLRGYRVPFSKVGWEPVYGDPPCENVAGWIAEEIGSRVHGAMGAHWTPVNNLRFAQGGDMLASSSDDGMICIWNVASGTKALTLSGQPPSGARPYMDISPDGTLVAFCPDEDDVSVFNTSSGALVATLDPRTIEPKSVAFSPHGEILATTSVLNNQVTLWSTSSWTEIAQLSDADPEFVTFSPDAKLIASWSFSHSANDGSVVVWDLQSKSIVREIPTGYGLLEYAAFSPGGDKIAVGVAGGNAAIWDIASGSKLVDIDHGAPASDVAFSPDGSKVALACSDHTLRIHDATSGAIVSTLQMSRSVYALDWSPDGTTIAFGCEDCLVRVLDAESGELVNWP